MTQSYAFYVYGSYLFAGAITDYDMSGNVLSSFLIGDTQLTTGLAMDVDGTLWYSDEGTNTLQHFSTSGVNLGSFAVASPFADPINVIGAEIAPPAPEPGTVVLMVVPLAGILRWRYRRAIRSATA